MKKVAWPKKIARIGGWAFLYAAFACAGAGLVAPEEEWKAWTMPAVAFIAGGLVALFWSYRGELSFRLGHD